MGHRDLGEYYWSVGDPSQAIKHFNKSREYCTSSQHILDYSLNVLQLLIETCDYAHIATYVFKAEGALSPPETKDKKGAVPPAGSAAAAAAASAALNPDREKAVAKMELANAISYLSVGNYEKAAFAFSKLNRSLDDWLGKVTLFQDLCTLLAQVPLLRLLLLAMWLYMGSYVRSPLCPETRLR